MCDENCISLRGPVERINGGLALCIPLDEGGEELHLVTEEISEIHGDDLVVHIPAWLAEKLQIAEGTQVHVDNRDGKFNITLAQVN
jgi:hypothetical protein